MTVRNTYRRDVDCARADETVRVAAQRMQQRSVGSLVVTDAFDVPIGIVTDRDLVIRALATANDPNEQTLADVMTSPVVTVGEEATIDETLEVMRTRGCRRLPVVDDAGRLSGILTLDDVLMRAYKQFEGVAAILHEESPRFGFSFGPSS